MEQILKQLALTWESLPPVWKERFSRTSWQALWLKRFSDYLRTSAELMSQESLSRCSEILWERDLPLFLLLEEAVEKSIGLSKTTKLLGREERAKINRDILKLLNASLSRSLSKHRSTKKA